MTQVNLLLKEIYAACCKGCQAKVVRLVQDRLTQATVREALEKPDLPSQKAKHPARGKGNE